MKIVRLFLVAAIALGLAACNNDVPEVLDGPEAVVSVQVVPSSNAPSIRLSGDLTGDGIIPAGLATESAIKNVEVWLFVGETPSGYKKGNDGEAFVDGITTTSGNKTMVVVANANIGAVANKAALLGQIKTLSQDIATGLVMTSEPVAVELKSGKNQYGFKTDDANYDVNANQLSEGTRLPITRINARIALVGLSYEFNNPFYDKFELTEVTMFNARKSSKLFGTSLVGATEFLYGVAYPTTSGTYVGSTNYSGDAAFTATVDASLAQAFVANPELTAPTLVNAKNAHYFYAFENTANTPENKEGTFIVLKGKLYKGSDAYVAPGLETDENGFTYYAIWVNDAQWSYNDGHTADGKIMRNTQYNLMVTLKKAGNPTIDPAVEAQLEVYVEVQPWTVVTQTVVWE